MNNTNQQQQQQSQLQQQQEQQQKLLNLLEFQAGLVSCLRSWSALRTSVEQGWGLANKGEEIRNVIVQWAIDNYPNGNNTSSIRQQQQQQNYKKPFIDTLDLEDYLIIHMEEEFSLQLEDESERQVSETIFTLFEQCCYQSNYTLSHQLTSIVATGTSNTNTNSNLLSLVQQQQQMFVDNDSDIDDDAMDMDNDEHDATNDQNNNNDTNSNTMFEQDNVAPALINVSPTSFSNVPTPVPTAAAAPTASGNFDINARIVYLQEYINQPLFGNNNTTTSVQNRQNSQLPVRQLGEAPIQQQQKQQPIVDDDGFAPVVARNKKR